MCRQGRVRARTAMVAIPSVNVALPRKMCTGPRARRFDKENFGNKYAEKPNAYCSMAHREAG